MEIITENSPDNESITVTSIKGPLCRTNLPEHYYIDFPYSFWMGWGISIRNTDSTEDICVGLTYEIPRWAKILQHITECEEKLSRLLTVATVPEQEILLS